LRVFAQRASKNDFEEEQSDEENEKDLPLEKKPSNGAVLKHFTLKSQLAETFMKQVAFKMGKYSKFGA
jgi:hypothetical protein